MSSYLIPFNHLTKKLTKNAWPTWNFWKSDWSTSWTFFVFVLIVRSQFSVNEVQVGRRLREPLWLAFQNIVLKLWSLFSYSISHSAHTNNQYESRIFTTNFCLFSFSVFEVLQSVFYIFRMTSSIGFFWFIYILIENF